MNECIYFKAVKLGAQASVAASEISIKVNEKVVKPTQEKVKEGRLMNDISTNVSSWANKVNIS